MRGLHNLSAFWISSISQSHITLMLNCPQQGNSILFQSVEIHFVDMWKKKFPLKCLTVHYRLVYEWCEFENIIQILILNVNVHKLMWIWYINNTETQRVNQNRSRRLHCSQITNEFLQIYYSTLLLKLICASASTTGPCVGCPVSREDLFLVNPTFYTSSKFFQISCRHECYLLHI
jgi:hypothetical protein